MNLALARIDAKRIVKTGADRKKPGTTAHLKDGPQVLSGPEEHCGSCGKWTIPKSSGSHGAGFAQSTVLATLVISDRRRATVTCCELSDSPGSGASLARLQPYVPHPFVKCRSPVCSKTVVNCHVVLNVVSIAVADVAE